LYSGIFACGSTASFVRRFAAASLKWKGMKIIPCAERSVTLSLASNSPRREVTRIMSPSFKPILEASRGFISTKHSGEKKFRLLIAGSWTLNDNGTILYQWLAGMDTRRLGLPRGPVVNRDKASLAPSESSCVQDLCPWMFLVRTRPLQTCALEAIVRQSHRIWESNGLFHP